jgi:glycosyltransferase involved in cell wall biosynthesis
MRVDACPGSIETMSSFRRSGRMLRIAHLSPGRGGVANAAKQLHAGLLSLDITSRLFVVPSVHQADAGLPHIHALPSLNRILDYADSFTRQLDRRVGLSGIVNLSSLFRRFPTFDVIHLHGMDSGWFNLHALPRLERHHALVWTMHDKHLGTGACGYPEMWGGCERWKTGCGDCPKAVALRWPVDCTHFVYQRKKHIVTSTRLAIVAPSRWMFDFISSAPITNRQLLKLIPYGVDTETFSPLPAGHCRAELKLPPAGRLLLAVASNFNEPRKGLHYYEPLLRRLKKEYEGDLGLVLVGGKLPEDILRRLQAIVPVYPMGTIDKAERLAAAYNACDLFVITSMIDNFPSVVLESLACGTPVAGFDVGGVHDMVDAGRTGVLSRLGDTDDLATTMGAILKDERKLIDMRSHCRDRAVRDYSRTIQASRYLELYQQLHATRLALLR